MTTLPIKYIKEIINVVKNQTKDKRSSMFSWLYGSTLNHLKCRGVDLSDQTHEYTTATRQATQQAEFNKHIKTLGYKKPIKYMKKKQFLIAIKKVNKRLSECKTFTAGVIIADTKEALIIQYLRQFQDKPNFKQIMQDTFNLINKQL